MVILFTIYLSAVLAAVDFPAVNAQTFNLSVYFALFIGMPDGIKTTALNILLFVPLGILLPFIWSDFRSPKNTVLFGFLLSLAIEVSQIFTFRTTGIDDLITNTVGTMIGYYIIKSINNRFKNTLYLKSNRHSSQERFVAYGLTALVVLSIVPFISHPIWDLIY